MLLSLSFLPKLNDGALSRFILQIHSIFAKWWLKWPLFNAESQSDKTFWSREKRNTAHKLSLRWSLIFATLGIFRYPRSSLQSSLACLSKSISPTAKTSTLNSISSYLLCWKWEQWIIGRFNQKSVHLMGMANPSKQWCWRRWWKFVNIFRWCLITN